MDQLGGNNMEIRKGDKFKCIKDVVMDDYPHETMYFKGNIYSSDNSGCITGENGDKEHSWVDIDGDEPTSNFFEKINTTSDKRQFSTGAVRDSNEGKSRPDLISPYFTERLGYRLAEGAKKYAERNWEKGIPDAAFLESLERHLVAYKMGKTDEDHAAAIAFNIMGIIHNEEVRKL